MDSTKIVMYVRLVIICLPVLLLIVWFQKKQAKKIKDIFDNAGERVEEFKIGRLHGFVNAENKLYVQEGANAKVYIIDLNKAVKVGYFRLRQNYSKYIGFIGEDGKQLEKSISVTTQKQYEQLYEFVKKYAPHIENIGRV